MPDVRGAAWLVPGAVFCAGFGLNAYERFSLGWGSGLYGEAGLLGAILWSMDLPRALRAEHSALSLALWIVGLAYVSGALLWLTIEDASRRLRISPGGRALVFVPVVVLIVVAWGFRPRRPRSD